jgi:hypothetical protein
MEVEDEHAILQRLFFKKFGRALPEPEKKKDDVDINFVIDLTDESDEMEVVTPVEVAVVKTEPIEAVEAAEININADTDVSTVINVANVNNVSGLRASRRLKRLELAKARKAITAFGKTLRKTTVIPEKEVPEKVIATDNTDMAEANPVESVKPVESVNPVESVEQTIAEANAAIKASREFTADFGNTPIDEFDD